MLGAAGVWGGRAAGVGGAARLAMRGRLRTAGALILAYHDIGDDPTNATDYNVSPAVFRRQLTDARKWGLRFVDLAELSRRVLESRQLDGLAAVVFDDSLVGVHHHAMPILAELDVHATVFAVSAALGSSPAWWPGAARVMTPSELRETTEAGMRVASHTRHHASLPNLEGVELDEEIRGSRRELEDLTQEEVDLFAYPFGHYDRRTRDAVVEAGYSVAYTFLNGRVLPGLDPFRLPRLNMWSGQGRARLAYHLSRPASSWPDHQLPAVSGPQAWL
jgi:peptidoglycan/xylan/chitin deacetylase (PgdA/CDA1 family)